MKDKENNPNHHMGKQTGYELINGEYHIAPMYVGQFGFLSDKKVGIDKMLAIVSKHASQDLSEIAKAERRIWQDITEDIGIDLSLGWVYSNGVIKPSPERAESK